MEPIQVNWVRDWKFKKFSSEAKKKTFRAKAVDNIEAQIKNLNETKGAKISTVYSLRWTKERSGQKRSFLRCYITPSAKFIPGKENSKPGGGQSTVSPTRPPSP